MAEQDVYHEKAPERTTPQGASRPGPAHRHEGQDANLVVMAGWLGTTAIGVAVTIGVLYSAYVTWTRSTEPTRMGVHAPSPSMRWREWGPRFGAYTKYENEAPRPAPPDLFNLHPVPPLPRILPNPADSTANPRMWAPEHPEGLPIWKRREDAEVQRLGLADSRTGLPTLPDRAARQVLGAGRWVLGAERPSKPSTQHPAPSTQHPTPVEEPMPSSGSGGTQLENRLAGEQ